ncbi:hypothetical protein FOMPIDRAFT_1128405 [Fomitopsis schrenkii]|uniref:Cytochrome c oxidase assembly protein COX20, mitochondrial n=1 Tax=Fomitopsis schrenkii TaxID=2126942 RepID=S8FGG5_FOMSC|nr:hypothetical protein FOMPIDRAFT_1128405 [Fomitopsis schrenkii]
MPDPENTTSPVPGPKKVLFETDSTGNYWTDVKEAVKKIGEIPCARSSLLSGIASGAGVGVIRGLSAGVFVASNWAVGTFMAVTLGSWAICRRSRDEERRRIQQVVEQLPKRFAKQDGTTSSE